MPIDTSQLSLSDQLALQRKQQMVDALRGMASQDIGQTQFTPQGYAVQTSPLQAIAKMAEGYAAGKIGQQYDAQLAASQQAAQQDKNAKIANALRLMSGIPGQNGQPAQPASNQDKMAALIQLSQVDPQTAALIGKYGFQQPAQEKVVAVIGQNGKPQYIQESKAAGMTPYEKSQQAPSAYFQPIQTAQGVFAFNSRTGRMEPVQGAGANVLGAQYDPNLQGNLASAKEAGKTTGAMQGGIKQHAFDANESNALLNQVEQVGPLATGSMLGRLRDQAAAAVGSTTDAANAAAQMKVLGAALTAKVPKMSGPQSDKDVALYKEAAGNIADPNIPWAQKQAAIQTIREINNRQMQYAQGAQPNAQTVGAKFLGFE